MDPDIETGLSANSNSVIVSFQEFLRDGQKSGIPDNLIIVHKENGIDSQKLCYYKPAVADLGIVAKVQVGEQILKTAVFDVPTECHKIAPSEDNGRNGSYAGFHHLPHFFIDTGKNCPKIPLLNVEAEWKDQNEIPIFQDTKAPNCPLKELDPLKLRDVSLPFNGEIGGYDNGFFHSLLILPTRFEAHSHKAVTKLTILPTADQPFPS
jgi:hypothetical protein